MNIEFYKCVILQFDRSIQLVFFIGSCDLVADPELE